MIRSSGTPSGLYQLGPYRALLLRNPESIGPIKYLYMLAITEGTTSEPILVVTCELSMIQKQLLDMVPEALRLPPGTNTETQMAPFLCYFDQVGAHHNVEQFSTPPDIHGFRDKAFALAQQQLRVNEPPRLLTPVRPTLHHPTRLPQEYLHVIALCLFLAILLFPPTTETYMTQYGPHSGHGGWRFVADVGEDNRRGFTESIHVALWLAEVAVLSVLYGVVLYLVRFGKDDG
jgi:hypothetical protein